MGAWTCDSHGRGAAALLGHEIAWQGRSLRGNDSVSMILLLGSPRGRLSAEQPLQRMPGEYLGFNADILGPASLSSCVRRSDGALQQMKTLDSSGRASAVGRFWLVALLVFGMHWAACDHPVSHGMRELKAKAEAGDVAAQFNCGYRYYKGVGVPQSAAEAVRWFKKAAEQADVGAQKFLGRMYSEGDGVPQNWTEASKWLNKAGAGDPKDPNHRIENP